LETIASPTGPASSPWIRRLTGPWAAGAILAAFWLLMVASLREKSLTFDEIGHVTAGYTYWRCDDYRLDPENGNLPQRLAGLPYLWAGFTFPSLDSDAWHQSDFLPIGDAWFNRMGNDAPAMLVRGRAVCGLVAVALGALVWWWARRLYGPRGAMLSLALFVLSPTILANGALMTSDTTAAFFFLASCLALWAMLQRLSPARVAASALAMGGLFVSKSSAVLIVPMALALVAARLVDGRPLPVAFGPPRLLVRRGRQAAALAAAALAHAAVVVIVIWACYGFRFSAFAAAVPGRDRMYDTWEQRMEKPPLAVVLTDLRLSHAQHVRVQRLLDENAIPLNQWTQEALKIVPEIERTVLTPAQARQLDAALAAPPARLVPRVLDWFYRHQLLPQAYLFGQAHVANSTAVRQAFLNGDYSLRGWKWFFPYTVLVKTPLPVFGVVALALAAAAVRWRHRGGPGGAPVLRRLGAAAYATLPLWVLLVVYWAVFLNAPINIGHRHILPTYPPVCVLCGVAADWCASRRRALRAALVALVVLLAAEVLYRFPNYLAYFNVIAGGPSRAYRHLVDSSLDWGQDLPGVRTYLDQHPAAGPAYLAYFGVADPGTYHIPAHLLSSYGFSLVHPIPSPLVVVRSPGGDPAPLVDRILAADPRLEFLGTAADGGGRLALLVERPEDYRLAGGTYFISATLLESLEFDVDGPWGPWNDRYEANYQRLRALTQPFRTADAAARVDALAHGGIDAWLNIFYDYEQYRFARLAAFLRQREPDDSIGFSILVYRLTDADVARALDGPPPERGHDVIGLLDEARIGPRP